MICAVILLLPACGAAPNTADRHQPSPISQTDSPAESDKETETLNSEMLTVQIGDTTFTAALEDNSSAQGSKRSAAGWPYHNYRSELWKF